MLVPRQNSPGHLPFFTASRRVGGTFFFVTPHSAAFRESSLRSVLHGLIVINFTKLIPETNFNSNIREVINAKENTKDF